MSALRSLINGRTVIASVSGGKDSAALSLWLTERGIEHRRVFADTGWEHPATYEYLRGPLTAKLGPIDEVKSPVGGMVEWIEKKAMFPSRPRRFCTTELKVTPLIAYFRRAQDELGEVISAVGIRAAESEARSKLEEVEWSDDFDASIWRPLLRWSEQDVIDIHTRHGLRPNPLYLHGARRVGCFPRIFSRKEEIRLVADLLPERIDLLRDLEQRMTEALKKRCLDRDEQQEFERLAFFSRKVNEGHVAFPIDEAVEWSRTSRGGRQFVLLDDAPKGCVRWGLCDTGGAA